MSSRRWKWSAMGPTTNEAATSCFGRWIPYRRLTVPDHERVAKGTLRAKKGRDSFPGIAGKNLRSVKIRVASPFAKPTDDVTGLSSMERSPCTGKQSQRALGKRRLGPDSLGPRFQGVTRRFLQGYMGCAILAN